MMFCICFDKSCYLKAIGTLSSGFYYLLHFVFAI